MGIESSCQIFLLLLAHQGGVSRTVMLEPADSTLHVVVHVKVTGKERRRVMSLLDRAVLESALAERGLDGFRLLAGTATAAMGNVAVKSDVGPERLEVMVKAEAPIGAAERLALATGPEAEPLDLVVLPGTAPVRAASRGRPRDGALRSRVGPGDRVSWVMRRR